MLSRVHGFTPVEGTRLIAEMCTPSRIADARKALRGTPDRNRAARILKRHKKAYELHAKPRNLIAHAKCVGTLAADHDFAAFQEFGDGGLLIEAVHIQTMRNASRWARAFADLALRAGDVPL